MNLSVMVSFMLKCGRQCHKTFNFHTTALSFFGSFSFFAGLQAQSSLNNQVDQLLLRLDALEGVEANEDGIGRRESSKQAVVSPEFKDQIDQNEISVEEKIDQLLKRLEDLEGKELSTINEPQIETENSLDGMMDPPEPLSQDLNFDEMVSDQAEFDTTSPVNGAKALLPQCLLSFQKNLIQ